MRGCASLLSCTCCTSGKYKQLSDVNWDYPVGGPPGLGPNMCFFFFPVFFFFPLLLLQLGSNRCFEPQFAVRAGSRGKGAGGADSDWKRSR